MIGSSEAVVVGVVGESADEALAEALVDDETCDEPTDGALAAAPVAERSGGKWKCRPRGLRVVIQRIVSGRGHCLVRVKLVSRELPMIFARPRIFALRSPTKMKASSIF